MPQTLDRADAAFPLFLSVDAEEAGLSRRTGSEEGQPRGRSDFQGLFNDVDGEGSCRAFRAGSSCAKILLRIDDRLMFTTNPEIRTTGSRQVGPFRRSSQENISSRSRHSSGHGSAAGGGLQMAEPWRLGGVCVGRAGHVLEVRGARSTCLVNVEALSHKPFATP